MTIDEATARDIFRKVMSVMPTQILMKSYADEDEVRADLGSFAPQGQMPPAFFSAGVLYVVRNQITDRDAGLVIIAHEVGHQLYDPGNIIAAVVLFNLWKFDYIRRHTSITEGQLQHMIGGQNIYSDIVLNRVIWKTPRIRDGLGNDEVRQGFMALYESIKFSRELKNNPEQTFKRGFLAAGMALGYLEIYEPAEFSRVMTILKNPPTTPALTKAVEIINLLVNEMDMAVKNLQRYYDVTVELFDNLYELDKLGFVQVR